MSPSLCVTGVAAVSGPVPLCGEIQLVSPSDDVPGSLILIFSIY